MSDPRRAKLLALLEITDTWLMASSAAHKAQMGTKGALVLLKGLVDEGLVVSRANKKGNEYALASRQHVVRKFVPNLDNFNAAMRAKSAVSRVKRANAAVAVLEKRGGWVSLKSIRMECAMSDLCAYDAMADLVRDGRAVAKQVRVGTKKESGEPYIVSYYATPEAVEQMARIEQERAAVVVAAPAEPEKAKEPRPKEPKRLTFGGPQLRLVEQYAARLKDGEEMGTADLVHALTNAAQLKEVYQTGAAAKMAQEVIEQAERGLGWGRR